MNEKKLVEEVPEEIKDIFTVLHKCYPKSLMKLLNHWEQKTREECEKEKEDPTGYLLISEKECKRCKESDKKLGIRCQYHSLIKMVREKENNRIRKEVLKIPYKQGSEHGTKWIDINYVLMVLNKRKEKL